MDNGASSYRRFLQGDESGLTDIVNMYGDNLMLFINSFVNNLTLAELAARCELTTGFLSQLEHNVSSPSIQTLENIIEALGSTLKDFFAETEETKLVFKKDDFYEHETNDFTI